MKIQERAIQLSMKASDYVKEKSENLAGMISLGGSTLLFFSGDMKSATAAAIFTAAELTLAKAGEKSAGYSAGALMFAAGDLTLAFSDSVQDGSSLQMTLIGMSAAWGIGAMKYPTEKAAEYLNSERLKKVSASLASVAGAGNLVLRVPGIIASAQAGEKLVTAAMSAWAVSDVLAGRLQESVKPVLDRLRRRDGENDTDHTPEL